MNVHTTNKSQTPASMLRNLAMFGVGFFLLTVVLAVFVIFPKINELFETQYSGDTDVDMALEVKLFRRYVESQKTAVQDLAGFPSVINSAMLSESNNPVLLDLFDNLVIGGAVGKMTLQDIAGSVIVQSSRDMQGRYIEGESGTDAILTGNTPYYFRLLNQLGDSFTFQMSVPVFYKKSIEGILSAEITVPLDEVFVGLEFNDHIGLKLVQDHISVVSDTNNIKILSEKSVKLENPDLTFVYITDAALMQDKKKSLRNTILMVLFTGLALSFLLLALYGYRRLSYRENTKNAKASDDRAYLIPAVVLIFGLAANITVFFIINNYQRASIADIQLNESKVRMQALKQTIDRNMDVLASVGIFIGSSTFVTRSEFKAFVTTYIAKYSDIQALQWIPNVPDSMRSIYEGQARTDGIEGFEFRELNSEQRLVVAVEKDSYYPVYYVEPIAGNESQLGLDLGSNDNYQDIFEIARESGNSVASGPTKRIQGDDMQSTVLILKPIYETRPLQMDAFNGEKSIRGFALIVLRVDQIVSEIAKAGDYTGSIYVQDVTKPSSPETLYGSVIAEGKVALSELITVAGRTWRIQISSNAQGNSMAWLSWLVLLAGLTIVVLISFGLLHLIRRKEMVEAIVRQRTSDLRMFSLIAESSNDMFVVVNVDGTGVWKEYPKICYVNDAFTSFTGYRKGEAIGNSPQFLHGENTSKEQLLRLRRALEQGDVFEGELLFYKKNGEPYDISFNAYPLKNEEGKITRYAAVQRDITEVKKSLVEREKLIDELTDSNEELERFAFVCSHDLQEPLRMIRSFSEKLQSHIRADLEGDDKGKKYFKFITEGATRAQDLIADILTYSSISNDTQSNQMISGTEIVDGIKSTMQVILEESGSQITTDLLPQLQGNKTQLHQLFQNLINNAIKYQAKGTTPKVHIGVLDAGEHWQFSVKDNGIGMEQRHLEKIFDVFQRLHGKSQYAGTGVGLSICKKVVARHGGKLWVESEVGVGSTFYFSLQKPILMEVVHDVQRKAG